MSALTSNGDISESLRRDNLPSTTRFLGYYMDEYGDLVINRGQVEVIERIFTMFGRKVQNSTNEKLRKMIWRCNAKYKIKCEVDIIREVS